MVKGKENMQLIQISIDFSNVVKSFEEKLKRKKLTWQYPKIKNNNNNFISRGGTFLARMPV